MTDGTISGAHITVLLLNLVCTNLYGVKPDDEHATSVLSDEVIAFAACVLSDDFRGDVVKHQRIN
jgi:hypothetical protein